MRKSVLAMLCCMIVLALLSFCAFAEPGAIDVLAGPFPMLVNKENPVDSDFVPSDLVLLTDVLDPSLIKRVTNWQVSAAYRSYSDQEAQLEKKISYYLNRNDGWSRSRARSAALRSVALPGCSEHHTGLAFDVNVPKASAFKGTKQCKWLHEHCWEYGFIVRYQEGKESITGFTAEEWHIRYVGTEHSLYIRDHNLCLEEYLEQMNADEAFLVVEEVDTDALPFN